MLLAVKSWESIHPLMKIIPVDWDYAIPFGLLYSQEPSAKVRRLVDTIQRVNRPITNRFILNNKMRLLMESLFLYNKSIKNESFISEQEQER